MLCKAEQAAYTKTRQHSEDSCRHPLSNSHEHAKTVQETGWHPVLSVAHRRQSSRLQALRTVKRAPSHIGCLSSWHKNFIGCIVQRCSPETLPLSYHSVAPITQRNLKYILNQQKMCLETLMLLSLTLGLCFFPGHLFILFSLYSKSSH